MKVIRMNGTDYLVKRPKWYMRQRLYLLEWKWIIPVVRRGRDNG